MNLQSCLRHVENQWHRSLVILAVVLLLGSVFSRAQRIGVTYNADAQTEAALKRLSPASQAVLERLSRLGRLPLGDLRYFAGDLSNGAVLDFDDSSWQTIQMPFIASADSIWLRKRIEVPKTLDGYDLTGAKIWLQEPSQGGLTVYLNGQPVARGEDMEPIVLFSSAKPGDKLLLAIRLEKTAGPKRLRRIELRMDFAPDRPNPQVLYSEFVSAAILIPSLAPDKLQAVDESIASVDLKALDAGDQQAFDASLSKAKAALASLDPILQGATYNLTGNSHIDAAWLWPWTETVDVVRRTFGTAVQLMDEYPTYTYTQSAAQYNVWMADKYPSINAKIKQRIKDGRWEIVGGMWVEPDLNMPDGESLVRQLLIGKRTYQTAVRHRRHGSAGIRTPSDITGSYRRSTRKPASITSLRRRCRGTRPISFRSSCSGGNRPTAARCWPISQMAMATLISVLCASRTILSTPEPSLRASMT